MIVTVDEHEDKLIKFGDFTPRVIEIKDTYGNKFYVPWTKSGEGSPFSDKNKAKDQLESMLKLQ